MPVPPPPLVLLFYDGYELKARERLGPRLFHWARCAARAGWRRARGRQVNTGFFEAFTALVRGLRALGCDVRVNDFAAARARPDHPIGLAGYPSVLTHVDLPNPLIFGPGDPGHPDAAGAWAAQDKVRFIVQPSDWFVDFYRPWCGDKMLRCPVGLDVEGLPDARGLAKSVDMLVYDKIRWDRDSVVPAVRDRLLAKLDAAGLSHRTLRYGGHTRESYVAALREARSMAFLCEHETQGLACEEALAMNVPVFAWDEGRLVDPLQAPFARPGLRVSSVPYFDESCGGTFTLADMEERFDAFWRDLPRFVPRPYIARTLSPAGAARVYLDAYRSLTPG